MTASGEIIWPSVGRIPCPPTHEVAHLLSLSPGSTYQLCRSGEIPALKLGNRWVIPKRRFHAWLDNLPTADPDEEV